VETNDLRWLAFYFTITNSNFTSHKIFFTEFIKGKWSTPDTAPFSFRLSHYGPERLLRYLKIVTWVGRDYTR